MARTMSDAAEKRLRRNARQHLCLGTDDTKAILTELDAERAAHEETKAEVGRLMVALHGDGSSVRGAEDEIAALKARLALAEVTVNALVQYAEHDGRCVRSTFSAGRPTPNGGYECLYGSTWYEVKPVDRTPACDCGLDAALDAWRAAK